MREQNKRRTDQHNRPNQRKTFQQRCRRTFVIRRVAVSALPCRIAEPLLRAEMCFAEPELFFA
jgi:hypothetical protein